MRKLLLRQSKEVQIKYQQHKGVCYEAAVFLHMTRTSSPCSVSPSQHLSFAYHISFKTSPSLWCVVFRPSSRVMLLIVIFVLFFLMFSGSFHPVLQRLPSIYWNSLALFQTSALLNAESCRQPLNDVIDVRNSLLVL